MVIYLVVSSSVSSPSSSSQLRSYFPMSTLPRCSLGNLRLSPLECRWTVWRGRRSRSLYARARQTQRAWCTAQKLWDSVVLFTVCAPLCRVCGVCVTVQYSRWTVGRWRGGETCVAISDRQDGGVPGAVVVERCISHGSRQRVGQRGGFRLLARA